MTIDLDALEKLADICLTVDPIGPGWYDEAHLRVHMEPSDAVFAEAANPATIKALIAELKALQAFAADEIAFAFCEGFKDAIDREKWDDCYDFAAAKAGDYRNDRIRAFLARNGKGEG